MPHWPGSCIDWYHERAFPFGRTVRIRSLAEQSLNIKVSRPGAYLGKCVALPPWLTGRNDLQRMGRKKNGEFEEVKPPSQRSRRLITDAEHDAIKVKLAAVREYAPGPAGP